METFEFSPQGYFNLAQQGAYFNNCTSMACKAGKLVVSFPVDGRRDSYATVVLTQPAPDIVHAEVYAENEIAESAFKQALAMVSLDIDGSGWAAVGARDHVIGKVQEKYKYLRPTLFHSPYEAAAAFVIGNRMSIKQRQAIMRGMAEQSGQKTDIDGESFFAFPSPARLTEIKSHPSLNEVKINRLKNIANAAIDGLLNRDYLRSLPIEMALTSWKNIPGIGEFYAQGILYRGAGVVNEITNDDLTPYAVQKAYGLPDAPDRKMLAGITENWSPYKMWCAVLLHVWLRNEVGLPKERNFIARV
jgi:3-methyladenine DNA glycosylase/8-oxoguanine DNA glycosylase